MADNTPNTTQKLIDPGEKHLILVLGETTNRPSYLLMGDIKNWENLNEPTKILLFHQLMAKLDKDWPYTLYAGSSGMIATNIEEVYIPPDICPKCGGLVYLNPSVTYSVISDIAKAVGLVPKVCMMLDADKCEEGAKWLKGFKPGNGLSQSEEPYLHTTPFSRFTDKIRIQQNLQESLEQAYGKEHTKQDAPYPPLQFYTPLFEGWTTLEGAKEKNKKRYNVLGV